MSEQKGSGPKFTVRRGNPWPFVRCERCHAIRHYEMPRNAFEWDEIETDMVKFALSHKVCPWIVARKAETASQEAPPETVR